MSFSRSVHAVDPFQEEPEEEPEENTKGKYQPPAGCERQVAQWCALPKIENNSAPTPRGTEQMKPETKPPTDPLPLCPPHLVKPKLYPYRSVSLRERSHIS